jgi:SAP domain-containing protein
MKRTLLLRASRLTTGMTLRQFDHGYWYATEIKKFARSLGVPAAHKLRKDELEKIIRHFLTHGRITSLPKRDLSRSGIKDVDRGLRLDRRVVLYTNDRETKTFLEREALKMNPAFKRRSGCRYRLNRWREAQLTRGTPITYRNVVKERMRK